MPSVKDLNKIENIQPRVKKSTGERKKTASVNDDIGEQLAAANTPEEVGKLAKDFGITLEECIERGQKAPNFGQWRMVLGNRIRGIKRRMDADSSLSPAEAAYPKKRSKPATKKAAGKKSAKKKTTKKSGKKTSKKAGAPSGKASSGIKLGGAHHLDSAMTEEEATDFAKSFGSTLKKIRELGNEPAAIQYAMKIRTEKDNHLVVKGAGDNEGRFMVVEMIPHQYTTSSGKKGKKKKSKKAAA